MVEWRFRQPQNIFKQFLMLQKYNCMEKKGCDYNMNVKTVHFEPRLIGDLLDIIHNGVLVIN